MRKGGDANRVDVPGDTDWRLDPETRYEFRLAFADTNVYVKTVLDLDDPDDPALVVKKVARQN